jgi:hypothetical protein
MMSYLVRFPARAHRRAATVVALSATLTLGYLVGVLQAHDVRLDDASVALMKAQGLVEAAQGTAAGELPPHALHQYERHLDRVLQHIAGALEEIQGAANVADEALANP